MIKVDEPKLYTNKLQLGTYNQYLINYFFQYKVLFYPRFKKAINTTQKNELFYSNVRGLN